MPKVLVFLFLLILAFHNISTSFCFAAINAEYSGSPSEVDSDQSFPVAITISGGSSGKNYYIKLGFQKESGANYFGYTKNNNGDWVNIDDSLEKFFRIELDNEGSWVGQIEIKPNIESTGFDGQGNYYLKLCRITEGGSETWYTNGSVITINQTSEITPTTALTPTPKPTEVKATATYKINKSVGIDGETISSVKVYVDGSYTHHYDDEVLEFCDGCFCDDSKEINCGFGEHEIKLVKTGYHDWSETKGIYAGDWFEINPEMAEIEPTSTPTNTPTLTPTITNTPTPEASASATTVPASDSGILVDSLATSSVSSSTSGDVLGETVEEVEKESNSRGKALAGGLIVIGGVAFLSAGFFSGKGGFRSDRIEE